MKKFRQEVKECIEEVLGIQLHLEPKLFLLGIYPPNCNRKRNLLFLDIGLLVAERVFAVAWKEVEGKRVGGWFQN